MIMRDDLLQLPLGKDPDARLKGGRVEVERPSVVPTGDRWSYSWRVVLVTQAGERINLGGASFRSDRPVAAASGVGNAALLASLVPLMRLGLPVTVNAPVSAVLLRNLALWQDGMSEWYPELSRVPIEAPAAGEHPACAANRGEAALFSFGVSSWHVVNRHRERLSELVWLDGIAPAVAPPARRQNLRSRLAAIARALGLEATVVETDAGDWLARWGPWEWTMGTVLGAVTMLLEGRCRIARLGSRAPSFHPDRHGYNPLIQPMFSTGLIRTSYDGGELDRAGKLLDLIDQPLALANLLVCGNPRQVEGNCGGCPRCMWTRVTLALLADPSLCPLMPPAEPDPQWIDQLPFDPEFVRFARELIKLAGWIGTGRHPLAEALQRRLLREQAAAMMEPETGVLALMEEADWRRLARHHRQALADDLFDHAAGIADEVLLPALAKAPREALEHLWAQEGGTWLKRRVRRFSGNHPG